MRLIGVVLGLLAGVLAGIGLILASPAAWFSGATPLPADLAPSKAYRWDDFRGSETGVRDLLGIGGRRPGVALFDPALANVRIGIITLPAGEGSPAAIAVKISTISGSNSLWKARLGTADHWNILWPGTGAVFATGHSNYWSLARDSFWAAVRGGGRELLATEYQISAEPPSGQATGVTGSAGRYAGYAGEYRESLFPAEGGPDWTLALKVTPPVLPAR